MPWSKTDTIPSLKNKSEKVKEVFAEAANAVLARGKSEHEAIVAGLGAVMSYEKKHNIKKAVVVEEKYHLSFKNQLLKIQGLVNHSFLRML